MIYVSFIECTYGKIAVVINGTPGSPFRESWKKFARQVDLPKDFISLWEHAAPSNGVNEIIIKMLEKWSDKVGSITLRQLTQVLHDIQLKSTSEAIKNHFNDSVSSNKSPCCPNVSEIPQPKPTGRPKNPKLPKQNWNTEQTNSIFKGMIYNRTSKTLFSTKKAKSVKSYQSSFGTFNRRYQNRRYYCTSKY